jgi:hypothetical protein
VDGHAVNKHRITDRFAGRARPSVQAPHTGVGKVKRFFVHLFHELLSDNITDVGAMMAYYAILALFPMMVFVVTLALLVIPDDTLQQGLAMATQAMPDATREMVTAQVDALVKAAHTGFAIGSFVLALWGASRGASSLMVALNAMFNKRETRPWWKRRSSRWWSRCASPPRWSSRSCCSSLGRSPATGSPTGSDWARSSTSAGASGAGSARACW